MSDTIHLDDDLNNVEFENDASLPRKLFIENITYDSAIFIFIIFVLFNSIYVYSGTCYPSSVNKTTHYYPLIQDYTNDEATVKILLQPLHALHRFIIMDGKALRHSTKYPIENNLFLNGKLIFLKDNKIVDENTIPQANITNYFKLGAEGSSEFHVFSQPIYSYFNGLNISLLFKTGFYNIRGFEFSFTFSDTLSFNSLTNTEKIILSSSAFYAVITFIYFLKGNALSGLQLFSIVLGIAAIFAPNPFTIFANNRFISFLSILFPILLLAIFRSLQIHINISILNRKDKYSQSLFLIFLIALAIYEICEFLVLKNRNSVLLSNSNELTHLEDAVIVMHMLYSFAICSLFGYNFFATSHYPNDKLWHFKSAVYGIFSLATAISTLITEVVIPIAGLSNDSHMDLNLYISSHVFASIAFIFLHHSVSNSVSQNEQKLKVESISADAE